MTDGEFIDLVRDALGKKYRVYVKDLPPGQAAIPIIKTNGRVSLAISSEFRSEVQRLRTEFRRKEVKRLKSPRAN